MLARHAISVAVLGGCLGLMCLNSAQAATPMEALQTRMECDFDKTPLQDVTDLVSKVHKVPLKLDAGVDGTIEVTLKYTGTLMGMLDKMLPSHGLEYVTDTKDVVIRRKKSEK